MPTPISPGGFIRAQEQDGSPAKDIKQIIIKNGKLVDAGAGAFQLQQFFKDLEDVGLADYTGLAGQVFQVNDTEDGVGPGTTYDIVSLSGLQLIIAEDGPGNRITLTSHPAAPPSHSFNHSATNSQNTTVARQEWPNSQRRVKVDLTYATQVRLIIRVVTAFAASTFFGLEYSLDESTWDEMDGASGPTVPMLPANTTAVSAWTDLTAAAKADVFLRLVSGGAINTGGTQTIGTIVAQFR